MARRPVKNFSAQTRPTARKAKNDVLAVEPAPKPGDPHPARLNGEHCAHILVPDFQIVMPDRVALGRAAICCWCAPPGVIMIYQGIVEEGHGPGVRYLPPQKEAPKLLVPGSMRPIGPLAGDDFMEQIKKGAGRG